MLVTSKGLFEIAMKQKFAIPATNFIDQNTLRAYIAVAEKRQLPLILSFAQAHHEVMGLEEAAILGKYYAKKADVPIILHLDHGQDIDFVKKAIDLGFTSVMIDASQDPFADNVAKTKEVITYARPRGVVVEAEIGHVGSGDNYENHDHSESFYTATEDAKQFYEETDVDSLAISIGTAHGKYVGKPEINFERLNEIAHAVPIPLVLHGGSSTGDENLNRCASNNIVKINIFTDLMDAAVKNFTSDAKNYFEVQEQLRSGIEKCLDHYYDVFQTKPVAI
ncbi:class II fructose-bisphosphate aldolase [Siminovitchia fortis]|uniref:Class II fructose-bisphosphate aldolase n=1 Tax=Siminovitchia fortis TaxID=254758 RepID=A0A443IVL2_9BACI|nr:class II fructose-bisphosphate aldolase [Siminovitchia fortis]RWR12155.1 class II fructose-bisphosphate aldolase [Siminovitchia fortis]WHY81010.1 class II fructose-bisphosphate aldolase [Siminovitchia fortis]